MKMDIKEIKRIAKQYGLKVDDLLALTKSNDPFYIQKNSREKAEWFADVWRKEGSPTIHPRGLHYQILGKYEVILAGKKIPYGNTNECWNYLEKGAKYARLLGLVPYHKILDEQNPDPKSTSRYWSHDEFESIEMTVSSDIVEIQLPKLNYEDSDKFIEACVDDIVDNLFEPVSYYPNSEQPNHLEIWAEKKGVIPLEVAKEYNATSRPAGSGEFSLDMCFKAVNIAKSENKDLHIFVMSDFDPKGRDMAKSVSRKVEFVANELGVNAFVHFIALTKDQCIEYALPTDPAKTPKNPLSTGGKAYISHTEVFKDYAGRDPTELNSFMAREPQAYRDMIREALDPFFDKELEKKYDQELEKLKERVREKITEKYEDIKEELLDIRADINGRINEFNNELQEIINEKRKELGLDEIIKEHNDLINIDIEDAVKDEEFEFPEVETEEPEEALLDTRRNYIIQIMKYKDFDIRQGDEKNIDIYSKLLEDFKPEETKEEIEKKSDTVKEEVNEMEEKAEEEFKIPNNWTDRGDYYSIEVTQSDGSTGIGFQRKLEECYECKKKIEFYKAKTITVDIGHQLAKIHACKECRETMAFQCTKCLKWYEKDLIRNKEKKICRFC